MAPSVFEGQQYVPEEYTCKTCRSPLRSVLLLQHFSIAILIKEIQILSFTDFTKSLSTYSPAKDRHHSRKQGGNAIMSAIDFGLDVDVTEDTEGNHRVIIKFDGKLLPYAKKGKISMVREQQEEAVSNQPLLFFHFFISHASDSHFPNPTVIPHTVGNHSNYHMAPVFLSMADTAFLPIHLLKFSNSRLL